MLRIYATLNLQQDPVAERKIVLAEVAAQLAGEQQIKKIEKW